MSEQLYRVHIAPGWIYDPMDVINALIDEGVLVPVKQCEHGMVDGHDVPVDVPGVNKPLYDWCEGAGIGGDDG